MTVKIHNVTVDARDAYAQSLWWTQVTGWQEAPDDPNEPEHTHCWIGPGDGSPGLLFINVPEAKAVKNRMHLDVQPTDRNRDQEVEWLVGIGASIVADHRQPDGRGFVLMADPEGNEFCVERSQAERAVSA
ncbi:VOC family protein [Catellatospora sp. NPDC049133]|jgi:catechol 2,3-dioxygenase-like lactoylglutathione lyase family enzyme|uniref:VOC family protein n=1 Tax=Catellatospora sp. NPDC049133 TaxID=3155499 RepID=UPI00340436F7